MSALNVYQGTTPTLYVNLVNPNGSPTNLSGCVMYYAARQSYSGPYLFNIGTTGLGANLSGALTGLMAFPLTTGDTTQCVQNYPAGFTLTDVSGVISKIGTEGFNVLPTV